MKKLALLSAAAACCLAAPAFAEEGDWTGAYVGVSAGYNIAKSKSATTLGGNWSAETAAVRDFITSRSAASQSVKDANFGLQAGFNAQVGENFVVGAEADVSLLSGKNDYTRGPISLTVPSPALGANFTFSNSIDPKLSYSVKGKIGVAMDKTLFYATGGWGWTRAELGSTLSSNTNFKKLAKVNRTFNGFVVGGGIEQKFTPNISARLDYTYSDQGDQSFQTVYDGPSIAKVAAYTETVRQDLTMHQVRVGINFHF